MNISNLYFYIPLAYIKKIRTPQISKFISWLFIFIFPTWYYSIIINHTTIESLVYLSLAIISIYEYGYIYNDTISIKKEKNATKRLDQSELKYHRKHKYSIAITRFLISGIMLVLLHLRSGLNAFLIGSVIIMCVLFYIYNNWRSKYNVFLYPFLVLSRFIPFAFIGETNQNNILLFFMLITFIYPFEMWMERFSTVKHRFPVFRTIMPNEESKRYFRIGYYITTSIFCIIIFNDFLLYLPFLIFLLYRISLLGLHLINQSKRR